MRIDLTDELNDNWIRDVSTGYPVELLQEPDPNLLETVLFTDEEIALAVIDFTQRSGESILDAETV